MPIYNIRGIDVDFPFEAYDCQIVYMDKVIQSLQQGCNALLESPTGTGKTLCLLCATLAWRKSLGEFTRTASEEKGWFSSSQNTSSQSSQPSKRSGSGLPVIIYTSRTHGQLKQVIRELKASNYRPRMSVLGSREQLCIHNEVRLLQGRAQNNACHFLGKKHACRHHARVSEFAKKNHELGNEPIDIEDLVDIGKTKGPCPYYLSRELHKSVDILFAPYNYLIDPQNRRSLTGIEWSNSVLIFDEAHNLETICADAASFDLPSSYLSACISEAKQCVELCIDKRAVEKSADEQHDPDNYAILRALLLKLEKRIAEVAIESRDMGFTRPGSYIYEFLAGLNITYETATMLKDTIDNAALLLEEGNTSESREQKKTSGTFCRLENIRDILNIIFRDSGRSHATSYRFHVQESQGSGKDFMKGKVSRTLSWWCFNPGLAMEEFIELGVRSIILTSGTLSPLDSFAQELNLKFPVRLENPHVISPNQVWVGVVPNGPSGCSFNSCYRNRDSLEYKQELGNAIVNFARLVPDGLLVFFPSYYLMDQCIECWKNMGHASSMDISTIWERICRYKKPVVEPKQSTLFPHAIQDFEEKLRDRSTTGAIFFAVCRGKVSEGLDFADQAGRAVVITGLPYALKNDPKIRLKRDYLDQQAMSKKNSIKALTGEEWYVQQAARAVNQAIGRVIRHRHDYGAIIFCDERFAQQSRQCDMSFWLRPHIKCYTKFGDVILTLTRFFREKGTILPGKQMETESISSRRIELCLEATSFSTTVSTADDFSRKPLSSASCDASLNTGDRLCAFPPANRSTLSCKDAHMTSKRLREQLEPVDILSDVESNAKYHLSNNECFVDLEKNLSICERLKCDDAIAPCSSKKFKSFQADSEKNDLEGDPQHIAESSSKNASERVKIAFQQPSHNQKSAASDPVKEARGSAFLIQVQEKLSDSEYRQFVELMKALKSKTMKVIPVLESIAKLFSIPGRSYLLQRFKDFVPAKYRPMYEQHLKSNNEVSDGGCKSNQT